MGHKTSGDNLLLLGMIAALGSSGVVSSQRYLGSFLDLGSILLQRTLRQRMSQTLAFMAHFLLLNTSPSFWATLNRVDNVCIMVSVILSVDETHHRVWPILWGIGPQCHPSSFGRCPGTFSVQREHIGVCTC